MQTAILSSGSPTVEAVMTSPGGFGSATAEVEMQAGVPPPPSFGGPTGGRFPATAGATYSGTTESKVDAIPPTQVFGGLTSGRSATLPARSFGALTGGFFVGLPAPINLVATVVDAGCIRLDWVDPGPEEDGYTIERSLSGIGDWSVIGTVAADVVTFLERFAVPLVVYDYRIVSFDSVKTSSPSNIATAVTPLPPDLSTPLPPVSPTDPPRNQIMPKRVEFLSPGAYGLGKDDKGDITGFKF